jgi:hypothetical protein
MEPAAPLVRAAGPALGRRRLLLGGAAVALAGAAGAAVAADPDAVPWRLRQALGLTPDPYVPDAPEGRLRLETLDSAAMRRDVGLFTAVPAGYGDGAGLPVVVVLHGASATVEDFRGFGFGRFVTAAVRAGAPPFVLAGTDDGPAGWVPSFQSDPQRMLREELPAWLGNRGYDAGRRAVWGWSRGGYGALRLALLDPDYARAWALFSPAVSIDDPALEDLSALAGVPVGVWCGTDDGFYDDVRALVGRLPSAPGVASYASGGHTRVFWNDHTLGALAWLADHL